MATWTIETYAAHNEALRVSEEKFQGERDRRYAEVKASEEKALKVKEQADRDALDLARQIQAYKDEKANELREQIGSERGLYATKGDLTAAVDKLEAQLGPVLTYMAGTQGASSGMAANRNALMSIVALVVGLITIGTFVFVTLRTPAPAPVQQPQVIYVPAPPGALLPSTPPQPAPR
jgi:hypothetical protein